MKKIFNIYTILLTSAVVFAASTSDFIFRIGPKGDITTERQLILTDNNVLRVPSGGGDIEFTNDGGSSFKKIGSGSGGGSGINVLTDFNSDFESGNPPVSWTASGGTFVADTATPLFGLQSGQWDSNASAQTLKSAAAPIERGFLGQTCQVSFKYRWPTGVAADIQLKVIFNDGSDEEKLALDLVPTSGTEVATAQQTFNCPDTDTTTMQWALESTVADPAPITIDNVFLGTGATFFAIPRNQVETKILSSTVNTDGNMSDLTFTGLDIGAVYEVRLNASLAVDNSAADPDVSIFVVHNSVDIGLASVTIQEAVDTSVDITRSSTVLTFTAVADTLFFDARGTSSGGNVLGDGTKLNTFVELEKRNDLSSVFDEAITLETSGGVLRAKHESDCTHSISAGAYGVTLGDSSCTFTPQEQTGPFSGVVSTTESTFNNSGIIFNSTRASKVFICANFTTTNLTGGFSTYALLQNSDTLQTVADSLHTSTNANDYAPHALCGVSTIKAGSNTFQILGKVSGGTGRIFAPSADGTIHWHIIPIDQQFPTPVFTDLQDSLINRPEVQSSPGQLRECLLEIVSDSISVVLNEGNCFSGFVDSGTAQFNALLNPGVFTSATSYICECTVNNASLGEAGCLIGKVSGAQFDVRTFNTTTGGSINRNAMIRCVGN